MKKLLIALLVLFPLSASAAEQRNWLNTLNNQPATTRTATDTDLGTWQVASPGNTYYIEDSGDDTSAGDYSEVFNIVNCKNNLLQFFTNVVDKTADNAELEIYSCPSGSPSSSYCYKVTADINSDLEGIDAYTFTGDTGNEAVDHDGNGNDNRGWIQDLPFPFISIAFSTDPGVGEIARVLFTCGS